MKKVFAINNKKKAKKLAPGRRNTFHIVQRTTPPGGEAVFRRCKGLWFTCGDVADGAQNDKDRSE